MVKDIALILSVIFNFCLLYLRNKRSDKSLKLLMSRLDDMEEFVHETKDETLKAKFRDRQMLLTKPLAKEEQKTGDQSTKELHFLLGGNLIGVIFSLHLKWSNEANNYLLAAIEYARRLNMLEPANRLEEVSKELIKIPALSEKQASAFADKISFIGVDIRKQIAENY